MLKGTRTVEETLYEGDLSGASGRVSKWRYLPLLIRSRATHFVTTGAFESHRNILFRQPEPLCLPTTTQAGETSRFAAHIHPRLRQLPRHPHHTPYCRTFDRTIGQRHLLQPRLPLMGSRGWFAELLLCSKPLQQCKRQWCRHPLPIQWRPGSMLDANTMVCKDNETRTAPTSTSVTDGFHRELRREVAKERGSTVKGRWSGFRMARGTTVESTDPNFINYQKRPLIDN